MTGIYLSPDWIVTTGLGLGVWTLVALALGIGIGKAIALADQRAVADDSTWLDDVPDGRTDTEVITVPREWLTRSTFEDLA